MAESLDNRPGSTKCLADSLEKPLLDDRAYRVIRLPNQLEALLIHDPDTDKASAAMDVNVGSLADPEEMQGMAHAVEHLLFMGTEKYPGENDYSAYLSKFGGHSNAFTAPTSTNYYFELSASATSNSIVPSVENGTTKLPGTDARSPLYGALDRFAQFFVHPLFLEDTLDRELRAVDSENKKNLQSDNWRLMQLNKSLSSTKHPFHLFSTGNYKILHDDPIKRGVKIREEFIKFYKMHYSANRMRLVVLGRESLDQLQGWVEDLFTDVYNQDLPRLKWDGIPAQTQEELCTQIFVKPVMDQRMLDISFPYPDEEELYASQPGRYISHLVGHEGPGSILAHLKAKGWANELSAGPSPVCPGTSFFSIGIRLTTEGLKNYRGIIKIVFQYMAMLKEQPPHEWIVDEQRKLTEVEFKFRQKIPASRTVSHLSGVMQKPLPRDLLLSGQSLIRQFDPEAIKRGLAALRPDNFRFIVTSQDYPGDWDKKEKWYGTEYKYEKIPKDFLREIEDIVKAPAGERPAELHLPGKNEFIPQRLDVERKDVKDPMLTPKLVRNDPNVRTWFKKDDQFWVPKANLNLFLRTPLINSSPFIAVVTQMYKELVDDSLMEYAYDAELAGLDYALDRHSDGIEVSVSGYNDKMHVLLEKVLVSMRDLEVKQDRFDIIKERMMRGYRNFEYREPFRQIGNYSRWLASERRWANHELLEELPAVTTDDVKAFFPQALRQMHIEILVHGNLYKEDALRMTNLVESVLKPRPLPQSQWKTSRTLLPPAGANYLYERVLKNPDNVNHCIEYSVMIGDGQDRPLRAKLLLLGQMADEPVFDTLRTKEQLGYVVGGGPLFLGTLAGYRILVQSEKDCAYLEKRIDAFLNTFENMIMEMSAEEFEAHKIGIINKRLEKLKNLNQETGRLWHHVSSEAYDFELIYRDVENIEPLTKENMLEFYRAHFSPDSRTRSKISVHLIAQASAEDIAAKIDPKEQLEKLTASVTDVLDQLGLEIDQTALSSQLEKLDLGTSDAKSITSTVGTYLKNTAGVAVEQVEKLLQPAEQALASFLPSLGIKPQADNTEAVDEVGDDVVGEKNKPVLIKDVKAFKASLPLSAGPRPVKDPTEFEDLESKL